MIPRDIQASLERYAANHVPTGSFLAAVLSNDLFDAVGRADDNNIVALPNIVKWIWSNLPRNCWGDRERVREWLKIRVLTVPVEDSGNGN